MYGNLQYDQNRSLGAVKTSELSWRQTTAGGNVADNGLSTLSWRSQNQVSNGNGNVPRQEASYLPNKDFERYYDERPSWYSPNPGQPVREKALPATNDISTLESSRLEPVAEQRYNVGAPQLSWRTATPGSNDIHPTEHRPTPAAAASDISSLETSRLAPVAEQRYDVGSTQLSWRTATPGSNGIHPTEHHPTPAAATNNISPLETSRLAPVAEQRYNVGAPQLSWRTATPGSNDIHPNEPRPTPAAGEYFNGGNTSQLSWRAIQSAVASTVSPSEPSQPKSLLECFNNDKAPGLSWRTTQPENHYRAENPGHIWRSDNLGNITTETQGTIPDGNVPKDGLRQTEVPEERFYDATSTGLSWRSANPVAMNEPPAESPRLMPARDNRFDLKTTGSLSWRDPSAGSELRKRGYPEIYPQVNSKTPRDAFAAYAGAYSTNAYY